jgi:hypothetical protein
MSTNNEMISFFNNEDNFNLLTDWEKRFVADLRKKSRITPRQRALLSKFYDRTNLVLSGQVQIDNETLVRVQNCLSQPIIERSSYEWLKSMMSSFVSQIKSGSKLTENQLKVVEDTEKNSAEFNNWVANWDPEKNRKFAVAVAYYESTSYFRSVVRDFKSKDDYIPDPVTFDKMTNNKYFGKIWEAVNGTPKYAEGSVVSLRSTSPRWTILSSAGFQRVNGIPTCDLDTKAFVIKANAGIPSKAVKNCMVYKILFFGSSKPVYVMENQIRAAKAK